MSKPPSWYQRQTLEKRKAINSYNKIQLATRLAGMSPTEKAQYYADKRKYSRTRYAKSARVRAEKKRSALAHHRAVRLRLGDAYVRQRIHKLTGLPHSEISQALIGAKREELRLKRKLEMTARAHKTPQKRLIYMREYMRRYKKKPKTKGTDEKAKLPPARPQGPAKPEASAQSACRELRRLVSASRIA